MGKASKWFRAFLGLKKPDTSSPTTSFPNPLKEKRGWSFVKSYREKDIHHAITTTIPGEGDKTATASDVMVQPSEHLEGLDLDKHAIAVAAATAVMAEAAVAAARAAAPVVRLSSSARCDSAAAMTAPYVAGGIEIREEWAAVKIQAAFRGCLARKALRALRGLVKLQALVRGHIERKRMAEWLQRMQALFHAQIMRTTSFLSANSSNLHLPSPQTPEKFESPIRSKSMKYDQSLTLKRNGSKSHAQIIGNQDNCWNLPDSRVDEHSWIRQRSSMRISSGDDERSVKILEIDSGKSYFKQRCSNLFHSTLHPLDSDQRSQSLTNSKDSTTHQSNRSPYSGEVQSYTRLVADDTEESPYCTVNNSPQIYSASSMNGSRRSPFIPSSGSCLSGYYEHPDPNYMACTESSMAKVRSHSAPKQRPYGERYGSSNRFSVHGYGELRLSSQRTSALQASFPNKAYPVSGRLDKLGMPMGCRH